MTCAVILSSGNDENGSVNYSSLDLFYNGQPVPQSPTASLSTGGVNAGGSVGVTGGTNWWGSSAGAPNPGPYGDFQNGSSNFYPVSAPQVLIGTSRGTAVPVTSSTVTINGDSYACTGDESTTVGPNPCAPLVVGQPTGTVTVPAGLAPGVYNLYIDESNTTPLPGNGPNDAYQTAQGLNLGTAESSTPIMVGPPLFNSANAATFAENDGTFSVSATGAGPVSLAESGALPAGVTFTDQLTGSGTGVVTDTGLLAGTPAYGTAGTYNITFTATDGNGQTTTQTFTLTVNPSAPTFTSVPATTFYENTLGSFSVTANGDAPVTFSTSGLPSGVTLGSDGTLSGTPAYGSAGTYSVTITATDGNANTTTQAFTLTVVATAATFTSGTSTTFTENSPGSFSVTANGDAPVTFSTTSPLPSGVTLSSGGSLSGTPAFGTAGTYPITIVATDGNANTAPQFFTLTVSAAPPVFTSGTSTSFSENSPGSFSVTANGDAPVGLLDDQCPCPPG